MNNEKKNILRIPQQWRTPLEPENLDKKSSAVAFQLPDLVVFFSLFINLVYFFRIFPYIRCFFIKQIKFYHKILH